VPLLLLLLLVCAGLVGTWGTEIRVYASEVDPNIGRPSYDFFVYYVAGRDWRLDLDPYTQHPDQGEWDYVRGTFHKLDRYIYPPTLLPLYGALSTLSYDTARGVWTAINLLALCAAITVAAVTAGKRWLEVVTASLLITLILYGFLYSLRQGQVDVFVSSLTVMGFLLYGRARSWPTAILLALAMLTKVMPIVIVLAMVAYYRDLRLLGKTALATAAMMALSLFAVDASAYGHYFFSVLPSATAPDPFWNNLSLLRFLSGAPAVAKAVTLIGWAMLALLCYDAGGRSRALSPGSRRVPVETERYAVLLLAVVFALSFSPLLWAMGMVWLIIPVALLVTAPAPHGRPWAPLVVAAGGVLAVTEPKIGLLSGIDRLSALGMAIVAVSLVLLYLPFRRAARDTPPR
jgi:hypothetical protein